MMRTLYRFLICLAMSVVALASAAKTPIIYVLPIDDEIGSTTWHYTRTGLREARRLKADMLLIHLNTYGGELSAADSIRTALLNAGMPTVAFVDNNAASAGALIALACDSVYMRPGASMGAATVVNGTDGSAMPDKYQSYMRAMMRATAESHGKTGSADSLAWRRNPQIAEAMVDPAIVVPGLIDSTKVLTLTADEAIRWHYADGKAESIADVMSQLGVDDYKIEQFSPTWEDRLIGFLTNPGLQAILIMLIIGGIYFELQTPGMGFPSMLALVAAIVYFLPLYITGIVSTWIILLFVAGLILLLIELFVIPGFGVTGIIGCVAMAGALFMGLYENFTFSVGTADVASIWYSLATFLAGLVLAVGAILYLTSRHGPKFVTRRTELSLTQNVEDGYIGVDARLQQLVGATAVATTDLRPSGKIEIDGVQYDAVSLHGFVQEGSVVKVVKFENAQLYV